MNDNGPRRTSSPDAELQDEAVLTLSQRPSQSEIDESYRAYERHPINEPDAWGDLASWREAVARP